MKQYREKLKIQNIVAGFGSVLLILFAVLAIGSELGWFSVLQPVAGDSHWHSYWYGYIVGASCGLGAVMTVSLIRNLRALKDEKKLKKMYVKENDERSVHILTLARNTAMQILLLVGLVATVIAGYFSITVSLTILACTFVSASVRPILAPYYNKTL